MKKRAISAILGTVIALAIVFTIFVPLFIYLQNLQTIFMQEANRRLQYELERIREKLEVHLTIAYREPHYRVWVIMHNPGVLAVSVPTIYIERRLRSLQEISPDGQNNIPPGGVVILDLGEKGVLLSPGKDDDDIIRVKVVTMRGNSFVSKERLGPRNLPYHLIVTLSNMFFGHQYEITVEQAGEYGCVSTASQSRPCGQKQGALIVPQSFSDTEGLAIFKVAPGKYTISVRSLTEGSEIRIDYVVDVYDDVFLNISIPINVRIPEKAPLRINATHKDLMIIAERTVTIPYAISLETIIKSSRGEAFLIEPLRDIRVNIQYEIITQNGRYVKTLSQEIRKLYPGQTYLNSFTIELESTANPPMEITYTIRINEANGELSRRKYSPGGEYDIERYEDSGRIKICVVRTEPLGDGRKISYVECPSS